MPYTPQGKGSRLRAIKKIVVDRWDDEGNFTVTVKVDRKPTLSASRKCYMYSFEHGETDISVNIDGIDRKVRMTFMLYVKVPASERRAFLQAITQQRIEAKEPQLY